MKIGKSSLEFKRIKMMFKQNNQENLIITDDLNVIELAVHYQKNIEEFYFVSEQEYQPQTKVLIDTIIKSTNQIYEISKQAFDSLSTKENQAGLIAVISYPKLTLDDLKDKPFLVVLDHLEIPGNVGTILRTLDSANVDGLIVIDPITKLQNPKITSSSRGCNLLIPTVVTSYQEAQDWLIAKGYTIYLGEPNLGKQYKDYNYKENLAIVVGNERFGINENWYQHSHKKVYIPMFGSNNSLNVSVATSILVYEAAMKRKNL